MKNLILVSLILQLVITINDTNGDYQFGDIVAFPRMCAIKTKPLYKHYAIYVGNKTAWVDIGQEDNDIFHRTGKIWKSGCKFGKLKETTGKPPNDYKDNYFDGINGFTPGSKQSIIKRITETIENCQKYKLLSNNCEHLATYVRYGVTLAKQRDTLAGFMFHEDLDSPEFRQVLERIRKDEEEEAKCQALRDDASKQVSYQPLLSACLALLCTFHHMTFFTEKL